MFRYWRWTGNSSDWNLAEAVRAFRQRGFDGVAEILPYLHRQRAEAAPLGSLFDYLMKQPSRLNQLPKCNYELEARHTLNPQPRVTVVVSLYDAREKLPKFMGMLAQTDMVRSRQADVVIVDSGSPVVQLDSDEIRHLSEKMDITFLRTAHRETIPLAWNRGIAEARGEYLIFLAADEAITHKALSKLASALDAHPEVDWVVSNAVLFRVDRQGNFLEQVMTYDRSGMTPFSPILDSTYLGYVAGMYRRQIHDRLGYYDPSFRGASDTEFKLRAYPFIRFMHLNETLGLYLDYPEERVTAHPRAEIEDLKALYLFKTVGGLRYLLQNKSEPQVQELLGQALGFRRSYATTLDTDFELAVNVARYLITLNPTARRYREWLPDLLYLQEFLGSVDQWQGGVRDLIPLSWRAICLAALEKKHTRLLGSKVFYHIFNDVRYAVHANVWRAREATL